MSETETINERVERAVLARERRAPEYLAALDAAIERAKQRDKYGAWQGGGVRRMPFRGVLKVVS